MKKISKRLIAIGITLVMMLGLVACGGPNGGEAKDENTLTVWAWDAQFNLYAMEEAEKIYQQQGVEHNSIQSQIRCSLKTEQSHIELLEAKLK